MYTSRYIAVGWIGWGRDGCMTGNRWSRYIYIYFIAAHKRNKNRIIMYTRKKKKIIKTGRFSLFFSSSSSYFDGRRNS